MAKGNLFNGYARGKVADVVFSRVKGQQVTRAYNSMPANPKTKAQMLQRLKLASCTRFYRRGQNALFRYAFEDKKEKESEFNAFTRHNANNPVLISKELYNVSGYPSFGLWQLTQGSLPNARVDFLEGEGQFLLADTATNENDSIWEPLYKAIQKSTGLIFGDIVTIVEIRQKLFGQDLMPPTLMPTPAIEANDVVWRIGQAVIGQDGEKALNTLFPQIIEYNEEKKCYAVVEDEGYSCALAMIYSRNTSNGLKVSDSVLVSGFGWYNNDMASQNYVDNCLASYGFNPEAILQGSIAKK